MDTQLFADPELAELHGAGAALAKSAFMNIDLTRPVPKDELLRIFKSLAPTGYLGCTIDQALGGSGLSYYEFGSLLEGVAEVAPFLSNHSLQRTVAVVGSDEVKARWLPPLLAGDAIGAVAITEPQGGSQLAHPRTQLEADGDDFRLSGQKIWAVHTMTADVAVVLAVGPGGDPVRVVVDLDHESVRREAIEMSGLRYLTFGLLEFHGTPVPKENVLIGQGAAIARKSIAVARCLIAVEASSIAQRATYSAIKQLSTRSPLPDQVATELDLIRAEIGKLSSATEAARFLAYHALKTIDAGDRGSDALASGAKAHATDNAIHVCTQAIELCAAEGLIAGGELQRLRNDAAMLAIADATPIVNHTVWGTYVIEQSQIRRG